MGMRKGKKVVLLLAAAVMVLALACGLYAGDYYRAEDAAVVVPEGVTVELAEDRVVFLPDMPTAGLIFYPGGKVEFTAYAPLMTRLAERGILCVLVKMPMNLAVLDVNAAEGIPEQYPQATRWYLAGHSLGGSMAASHGAKNADAYQGLILLAAYSTEDLRDTGLAVCSLYGDRDGVLDPEKYQQYRPNLPEDTLELVLEGGNHAGFGSYGRQDGDGISALEPGAQMDWTAERILEFVEE